MNAPDPEWVQRIIQDAVDGIRHEDVCYDSRCGHFPPPHPKQEDCPLL